MTGWPFEKAVLLETLMTCPSSVRTPYSPPSLLLTILPVNRLFSPMKPATKAVAGRS